MRIATMSLRTRRGAKAMCIIGAVSMFGLGVLSGSAVANHNKGTYGNEGYQWFARYDDFAVADITSDYCNDREQAAYNRVLNSTAGESFTSDYWPSGIRLRKAVSSPCSGTVSDVIDIDLNYQSKFSSTHGNYGGENHSSLGSTVWCASFNAPYPCGYHVSVVHLNKARWTDTSISHAYRERLLMHETGHSLGLGHHCESDAIMNDGMSNCNGGRFTQVMEYRSTDRQGIRQTYPNWPY